MSTQFLTYLPQFLPYKIQYFGAFQTPTYPKIGRHLWTFPLKKFNRCVVRSQISDFFRYVKGAFIYDVRCFWGIFDLPTYPNQMVYYIGLIGKIRCSLTYLPTQKSDVIYECSLITVLKTSQALQVLFYNIVYNQQNKMVETQNSFLKKKIPDVKRMGCENYDCFNCFGKMGSTNF